MNALRSAASQLLSAIPLPSKAGSGPESREAGNGEPSTSGRTLEECVPEIRFGDETLAERKLQEIWAKYRAARDSNEDQVCKVMLQVLLKEVAAAHASGWDPDAGVEAMLSQSGAVAGTVLGSSRGHPAAFVRDLVSELRPLEQRVCYMLEKEVLTVSELQGDGGLRLLDSLSLVLDSSLNQIAFVDARGLHHVIRIARNAINQLHAFVKFERHAAEHGSEGEGGAKLDYLRGLLARCLVVLSKFRGDGLAFRFIRAEMMRPPRSHPMVEAGVCSSEGVEDLMELLRILRGSQPWLAATLRLKRLVLEVVKTSFAIHARDTGTGTEGLGSSAVIETVTSVIGDPVGGEEDVPHDMYSDWVDVQLIALEVVALSSMKKGSISVQHFIEAEGKTRLVNLIASVLRTHNQNAADAALPRGAIPDSLGSMFDALEVQLYMCKENERFVEVLIVALLSPFTAERGPLEFVAGQGTQQDSLLAFERLVAYGNGLMKWLTACMSVCSFTLKLLEKHRAWDVLMGNYLFALPVEASKCPGLVDASGVQLAVSTFLNKAMTSHWNLKPSEQMKVVLESLERWALQPGSCLVLLNLTLRVVGVFPRSQVAALLQGCDFSLRLSNTIKKQHSAPRDSWQVVGSDGSLVDHLDVEDDTLQDAILLEVLKGFRGILSHDPALQEGTLKEWNAVAALFALVWEGKFHHQALGTLKDLMMTKPSDTDGRLAKSVLYTRFVEALPRAQSEHPSSGVATLIELLGVIQEVVRDDPAGSQELFYEAETILQVLNLMNGDYAPPDAAEVCSHVLRTLGHLVGRNARGIRILETTLGWGTLQQLLLRSAGRPVPGTIFRDLLAIATDSVLEGGRGVAQEVACTGLLSMMLEVLQQSSPADALEGLRILNKIHGERIIVCCASEEAGLVSLLFSWYARCTEESLSDEISGLIETIGRISLSAKDLRSMLRAVHGTEGSLNASKLARTARMLREMAHHDGPSAFVDYDGMSSGVTHSGKLQWGGSRAYSFASWLRFKGDAGENSHGKVLYCLQGKTGKVEPMVLAVLEEDAVLIHMFEAKVHTTAIKLSIPKGKWFHLVIVHDNSGTFSASSVHAFLNGAYVASEKLKYPKGFDFLSSISIGYIHDSGSSHDLCKWLLRFKGQIGNILLFQEALSAHQVTALHNCGPDLNFSLYRRALGACNPFVMLDAKASRKRSLVSISEVASRISFDLLEGGSICRTRVMSDMLHCIGGNIVLLSLFYELGNRCRTYQPLLEELDGIYSDLLDLLGTIMSASSFSSHNMDQVSGFLLLGRVLGKSNPSVLTPALLGAIRRLIHVLRPGTDSEPEPNYRDALKYLLVDLRTWQGAGPQAQAEYLDALAQEMDSDYALCSQLLTPCDILDALRTQAEAGQGLPPFSAGLAKLMERMVVRRTFESDRGALLALYLDDVDHQLTRRLLQVMISVVKSAPLPSLKVDLKRLGAAALFKPLEHSQEVGCLVDALYLLEAMSSGRRKQCFEPTEAAAVLGRFGAKLLSASGMTGTVVDRLLQIASGSNQQEVHCAKVLLPLLGKVGPPSSSKILNFCTQLLSKPRRSVDALVGQAGWEVHLVDAMCAGLSGPPSRVADFIAACSGDVPARGDLADASTCWNVLCSLLFYCLRYVDNGHMRVTSAVHRLVMAELLSELDCEQLASLLLTRACKSLRVQEPDLPERTPRQLANTVRVVELCRDLLVGGMAKDLRRGSPGGEGGAAAASADLQGGEPATGAPPKLWQALGFVTGSGDVLLPNLAPGFVDVVTELLANMCAKSEEESREDPEASTVSAPPSPRAELSQDHLLLVFRAAMASFTAGVNADAGRSAEREERITCVISHCASQLGALPQLRLYACALAFALGLGDGGSEGEVNSPPPKLTPGQAAQCASLAGHLEATLKVHFDHFDLEPRDVRRVLTGEVLHRVEARQQAMLVCRTSQAPRTPGAMAVGSKEAAEATRSAVHAREVSDRDTQRRVSRQADLRDEQQHADRLWRGISRQLGSEAGIWGSPSHKDGGKWKVDKSEDASRRRMKLRRLWAARSYVHSSEGSEGVGAGEQVGDLMRNLPVGALADLNDEDADLVGEGGGEGSPGPPDPVDAGEDPAGKAVTSPLKRVESLTFDDDALLSLECQWVTLKRVVRGKMDVYRKDIVFKGTVEEHTCLFGENVPDPSAGKRKALRLRTSRLTEVHHMRHMLEPKACEVFWQGGSAFFAFATRGEMKEAVKKIASLCPGMQVVNRRRKLVLGELVAQRWRKGEISNFAYLSRLNTLAGRTYNDLSQYPVFPWVLSDYTSDELDLEDSTSFRDLSKPMGALTEKRRAEMVERYELAREADPHVPAFHYGSHYSSAGIVLYYLIRVEPMTFLHTAMQGGKIDHADRLFSSLAETWRHCTEHSADFKEAIPEMFYFPEMFQNVNDVDFGTKQSGERLGDVVLPPWARGDPHRFVRLHRAALESRHVSGQLHLWVDLIFGFKQRGQEAVQAVNVFQHFTYEGGVDLAAITEPRELKAVRDQILYFGQTPSQVLLKKGVAKPVSASLPPPLGGAGWHGMTARVVKGAGRTMAQHISLTGTRLVVVDAEAVVHLYKWSAPSTRGDLAQTFAFAPTVMRHTLTHERSQGALRPALRGAEGSEPSIFVVLAALGVLVSAGHWDNSVRCYALEDGTCRQGLACHKDAISAIARDAGDKVVVTGSRDTTLMVWQVCLAGQQATRAVRVLSEDPVHVLYGHRDEVACVAVSVDLDVVVSSSASGAVFLHSLSRGEFVRQVSLPPNSLPRKVQLHASGLVALYCKRDLSLHVVTVNGAPMAREELSERATALEFTDCGGFLALGTERGRVQVRRAHDLVLERQFDVGATLGLAGAAAAGAVTALLATPDGCLVTGMRSAHLVLVSPEEPAT